ncbi:MULTISPECIES: histidine triad nucleotide-binding protein [Nitrosomonas]|jgi:histidine triad (HIT) family protein|uniref:Histidine triad (HIT) family protein n=1 Tax=Nitrosomonas oligotropha TaxID=42354 RepID=A0A1H8QPK4_9PROT|nr:histidine triad nucleotide-binding protein [Nitrosomonas oligotropha]SDW87639.1 histidine triad (HIT) family protein [Nitrosomonas oligotropha]SEO56175.1 histidine triad (HIT) family protein [Nitrosomonas oligotropha]
MDNCIFCKIARKEIPSNAVYEDDDILAFHDINPAAPVHFLLIPKLHIDSLAEVQDNHQDLLGKMLLLAPKLAKAQGCEDGFRTIINTGRAGGQEVFHIHFHIIGGRERLPGMIHHG